MNIRAWNLRLFSYSKRNNGYNKLQLLNIPVFKYRFHLPSTWNNICIKQFFPRFFGGVNCPQTESKSSSNSTYNVPHNSEICHGQIKGYETTVQLREQELCQVAIIKKWALSRKSPWKPPLCTRTLYWGGSSDKKTSPGGYGYFLKQHNTCMYFCVHQRKLQKKMPSILSGKHKFEHTASCSSSSASAANSPFLIPSEFLLVSSSERGNWYRVLRAFIRTCGNKRISMLINEKWK